ncbi:glucokinase [Uncinocarpus reesii 1704]|uniref:Phosphotransferase n=1 Tax=Uncinocarpus reesii (strain UAMH 1704) TaxID=336963 RepID=C4JXB4_UNCRE|nr:glucokinase [Uncinocarpus reesii 1704]EEP81422.1 glucokinase [Uncinocarpus reesii 1704]
MNNYHGQEEQQRTSMKVRRRVISDFALFLNRNEGIATENSDPARMTSSLVNTAWKIAAQFQFTDSDVRSCARQFIEEMRQVADWNIHQGLSLAVDLGGTNLRVCSVDLHGDGTFHVEQTKVAVSKQLMVAPEASQLFSYIAAQIKDFLELHHGDYLGCCKAGDLQPLSLGFTFSFPAYQTSIQSGVLLRWTKGYDIPCVVGQDVCQLLQQEISLLRLPVRVTALVNDAAGTIMSRAYTLPLPQTRTSIGAIFGTGTNCVYLEKLSNISKHLDGDYDRSTGEMFISIEWGSFNNHLSVLPNTPYDEELNASSANRGNQMFEKRVSGMFLGELLRIVLLQMHEDPQVGLFRRGDLIGVSGLGASSPLRQRWSVDSSILSTAEADTADDLGLLREVIQGQLGVPSANISIEDASAVKTIACAIGRRAARLAGMAIGAVVLKVLSSRRAQASPVQRDIKNQTVKASNGICVASAISDPETEATPEQDMIDIGVDGSLIEHYPRFEKHMREALRSIDGIGVAGEKKIRIGIAKDGSSVGAAIIALLATQSTF